MPLPVCVKLNLQLQVAALLCRTAPSPETSVPSAPKWSNLSSVRARARGTILSSGFEIIEPYIFSPYPSYSQIITSLFFDPVSQPRNWTQTPSIKFGYIIPPFTSVQSPDLKMDAYSISYTTPSRRSSSRIYQDLATCRLAPRSRSDNRSEQSDMESPEKVSAISSLPRVL
jgi:hypothetical protein